MTNAFFLTNKAYLIGHFNIKWTIRLLISINSQRKFKKFGKIVQNSQVVVLKNYWDCAAAAKTEIFKQNKNGTIRL